jgi:hypothetical protein
MKMKNLIIILITLIGISFLVSCEKAEKDPVLDMNQTVMPEITSPAGGSTYVLVKEEADNLFTSFEWTNTGYNLTNLEATKYVLQMDLAGNNFDSPIDLVTTTGTSYTMTVAQMNNTLIGVMELPAFEVNNLELRLHSFVNQITPYTEVYSDVIQFSITPYEEIVFIKPIYLIGDATPAGWDNMAGTPMQHIGSGKFAVVETLNATGDWIKFLSVPGQWAPQWGTDASGTSGSGNLVYRPDENTADPASIPSAKVEGDYYIMADTLNLLYEIFMTSGNLFLVGDATPAGWDAGAAIAFAENTPHVFTLTTSLNAGGGMKFLEVQGAWAPQWGTNDKGNNKKGILSYRPTEAVPDPPNIPGPSAAGQYTITVDMTTMMYTIEAVK